MDGVITSLDMDMAMAGGTTGDTAIPIGGIITGGINTMGAWYPYGYPAPPPVVIEKEPQVYVQPEQKEENYWYYCPDPQGYYPYIRQCASGWLKVVPDTTPPNQ